MQSAPFIRLSVPFIIGICIQYLRPWAGNLVLCISLGIIALLAGMIPRKPAVRFRLRAAYGISMLLFFCAAGMYSVRLRQQQERPLPTGCTRSIARIDENNGEKERSIACTATLKHLIDSEGKIHRCEQKILLYFYPEEHARSLIQGNYIIFTPNLSPIRPPANPESFDFASYARRKGILYSQYLPEKAWRRIGHSPEKSLKEQALQLRERIRRLISGIPLGEEEHALLNALLLGDTSLITDEQRGRFSAAGLSHILAVSGLHTGIIWWLLAGFFYPLTVRAPRLRYLLIMAGLWCYAYITGLSPSVTRACIMATVILTGYLIGRKGNLLNSLFAAAFFMLLYQPYYLFDIGFQLSYLAVLSIALFYPAIVRITRRKSWIGNKTAGLFSVSLAAQAGTLPVAAYYFHTVPLLSLVTNVFVVPLLPFVLGAGLLSVAATALNLPVPWIYRLANGLLHLVISVADYAVAIPGHVWQVWVEPRHLILYGGLLFFLYQFAVLRKKKHIIFGLSFMLLFLMYDTLIPSFEKAEKGWIVYHDSQQTVLHFFGRESNFLFSPDSLVNYESARKASLNFRIKNRLPKPKIASDTLNSGRLYIRRPFILFDEKRILLLDSISWKNKISGQQLPVDYAIVTTEYKGRVADLLPLFSIKQLIIPSNIPYFKSCHMERECLIYHIPCHVIRNTGAWIDIRQTRP